MFRFAFRISILAGLMAWAPVAAHAVVPPEKVATVKAGKSIWSPDGAPDGPVEIVIGLAEQRAFVFRGGELIGVSGVSSGRKGAESPIGRFQILEKKRFHRSNRYDDAPMPFMQRLNWFGVALHAGEVTGRPASHGCIRLPASFAKQLFAATEVGGFVFVTEEPIDTPETALKLAQANQNAPFGPGRTFDEAPGGGARKAR